MVEGGAAEQADFGDIRRAIARVAALALDRFDHRRLFAADIGAGAAAKLDEAFGDDAGLLQRLDLMRQDVQHRRIFVAHVKIDALGLDRPGGDQRALEHLLRVALEIIAVLERAGLALVAVDGHQPGPLIGAHDLPFAPGGEACAAEPAQAGVGHLLDDGVERQLAGAALLQHGIAAIGAILGQRLVAGNVRLALAAVDRRLDRLGRGVIDEIMSNLGDRRRIAASHARRAQHAHLGRVGACT